LAFAFDKLTCNGFLVEVVTHMCLISCDLVVVCVTLSNTRYFRSTAGYSYLRASLSSLFSSLRVMPGSLCFGVLLLLNSISLASTLTNIFVYSANMIAPTSIMIFILTLREIYITSEHPSSDSSLHSTHASLPSDAQFTSIATPSIITQAMFEVQLGEDDLLGYEAIPCSAMPHQ